MMQWTDALGKPHARATGMVRIVSLVPSLTELVLDLGLGPHLVGRTGFCVHPRDLLRAVPKVGGTKGFDRDKVLALAPTHVLVNIDENRRAEVEALAGCGPEIVVTHPLAPEDNCALYRLLGGIFDREALAESLCQAFGQAWTALRAAAAGWPRERVLYLIWKDPWMTVGGDTYIARMLDAAGWAVAGADDSARYPVVDLARAAARAERILLPSEPYPFRARDAASLAADPRAGGRPVLPVDGEMVSWYGSRAIRGLDYLRRLRHDLTQVKG